MIICTFPVTAANGVAVDANVSVFVNGIEIFFDARPQNIDDRVMVPFRKVAEGLGAELKWDEASGTVTMTRKKDKVIIVVGSNIIIKNDKAIRMEQQAYIYEKRVLIPIRAASEALGAKVIWDGKNRIIDIIHCDTKVDISGKRVGIGDSVQHVISTFGYPNREDNGIEKFSFYVYNIDYAEFIMIGIRQETVISIFVTNSQFKLDTNGDIIGYGSDYNINDEMVTPYLDKLDNNKLYGVWIGKIFSSSQNIKANFAQLKEQVELETIDCTNAFRVAKGVRKLYIDKAAMKTTLEHSEDMAKNNYFTHEGRDSSTPWDRYYKNKGVNFACGENICGGYYSGIDNFDAWVNSVGHRENMLNAMAMYTGVGFAYNDASYYKFYMTQLFTHPN